MAFPEHCGRQVTEDSRQGRNRPHSGTELPWKPANPGAIDAAKRRHVQPGQPRQSRPTCWTQYGFAGMACGREGGREESQPCPRTPGQPKLLLPMGGAGHQAPAISYTVARTGAGPATCAQMDTRTERCSQSGIAGNHQHQAPGAADPCEVASERGTVRRVVVPEDDAAKPAWQSHRRWAGVRHAMEIGEQPQFRQAAGRTWPRCRRTRPGKQARVH
jgi:hypothetical protein